MKTYVVGTHLKCLDEVLLMSIHNIHFCGGNKKNIKKLEKCPKDIDAPI